VQKPATNLKFKKTPQISHKFQDPKKSKIPKNSKKFTKSHKFLKIPKKTSKFQKFLLSKSLTIKKPPYSPKSNTPDAFEENNFDIHSIIFRFLERIFNLKMNFKCGEIAENPFQVLIKRVWRTVLIYNGKKWRLIKGDKRISFDIWRALFVNWNWKGTFWNWRKISVKKWMSKAWKITKNCVKKKENFEFKRKGNFALKWAKTLPICKKFNSGKNRKNRRKKICIFQRLQKINKFSYKK
jgi:hypothetical protein